MEFQTLKDTTNIPTILPFKDPRAHMRILNDKTGK